MKWIVRAVVKRIEGEFMKDKIACLLAIGIPVALVVYIGWASVNYIQNSFRPENSEMFYPLICSGLILGVVACIIFFVSGMSLGWANWLVLLSGVFTILHLLTEFVVTLSRGDTNLIAYATALVFPLTTIFLFRLLMQADFAKAMKVTLTITLCLYIGTYYWHLSLLHHPSGWGWKSGFVLFFGNCFLITLYYMMHRYRDLIEWLCDMPEL